MRSNSVTCYIDPTVTGSSLRRAAAATPAGTPATAATSTTITAPIAKSLHLSSSRLDEGEARVLRR